MAVTASAYATDALPQGTVDAVVIGAAVPLVRTVR